ncbi:hypothetical protein D3C72_2602410 [compost metagenome]
MFCTPARVLIWLQIWLMRSWESASSRTIRSISPLRMAHSTTSGILAMTLVTSAPRMRSLR